MFRLSHIAIVILACAAAPVVAQSAEQVVPAAATLDGANACPLLLGANEVRTQLLIRDTQLGALRGKAIRRIALRRDMQKNETLPFGWKSGWVDLEIVASWTSIDPLRPTSTFARNRGAAPIVVFKGPYQVTASPQLPNTTAVAPFLSTVSPELVLQRPIPAGIGTLCLEIVTRNDVTRAPPMHWLVDVFEVNYPAATTAGTSCWRRGHAAPDAATVLSATSGGTLICATDGPGTGPALLVIGASATRWGIFPLPLDLTIIGAPGCALRASWSLVLPAALQSFPNRVDPKGYMLLDLPPGIGGAELHTQWIFFDPSANQLGLTMTNRASVRLATPAPGMSFSTVQSIGTSQQTGEVWISSMPVLKLFEQ